MVGVHLRDDEAAEGGVLGEDRQGRHRIVDGEALVALIGVVCDGEVDEVDHVDVEVDEEAVDPPSQSVGGLCGGLARVPGDLGRRVRPGRLASSAGLAPSR